MNSGHVYRPLWALSMLIQTLCLVLLWLALSLQQWFTTVECGWFLRQFAFASLPAGTDQGEIERRFSKPDFIAKLLERHGDRYRLVEQEWYYMCSDEPILLVMDTDGRFRGYHSIRSGVLNRPLYIVSLIHVIYLVGFVLGIWSYQILHLARWSLSLYAASLVCMDVLIILTELYPVSLWRFTFRWLSVVSGILLFMAVGIGIACLFLAKVVYTTNLSARQGNT